MMDKGNDAESFSFAGIGYTNILSLTDAGQVQLCCATGKLRFVLKVPVLEVVLFIVCQRT